MTIAWIIPITYNIYLLGLMIQNGFNSYANKPLMSYGILTTWWFILSMFIITIAMDILFTLIDNRLKDM